MAKAGELLLVHGTDWLSRLIQKVTHSHWCHIAIVVSDNGDLVEALHEGISRTTMEKYRDVDTQVVETGLSGDCLRNALAYADKRVGEKYDWFDIVGIGVGRLTGSRLILGVNGKQICSGLAAEFCAHGGIDFGREEENMSPADIATFFHTAVQMPGERQ